MQNFIIYNFIVAIVYYIFDYIFSIFGFYNTPTASSNQMLSMPSSGDMNLIIINFILSSIIGIFLLKYINDKINY